MAIGGIISMSNYIDITTYKMDNKRVMIMYVSAIIFISFIILNSILGMNLKFGYSIFGIIAVWLLYDKIVKGDILCNKIISKACSYTFFIYLIHEPVLLIFKKLPLLICHNQIVLTIYFITIPIIFVVAMIYLGNILRKHFPKTFTIYTGGR